MILLFGEAIGVASKPGCPPSRFEASEVGVELQGAERLGAAQQKSKRLSKSDAVGGGAYPLVMSK